MQHFISTINIKMNQRKKTQSFQLHDEEFYKSFKPLFLSLSLKSGGTQRMHLGLISHCLPTLPLIAQLQSQYYILYCRVSSSGGAYSG